MFAPKEVLKTNQEIINQKFEHSELFSQTVTLLLKTIKEKNITLSIQQILICVEEIYLYSLAKNPKQVDKKFSEWFIGLMVR